MVQRVDISGNNGGNGNDRADRGALADIQWDPLSLGYMLVAFKVTVVEVDVELEV
jgi:hypothetical protein